MITFLKNFWGALSKKEQNFLIIVSTIFLVTLVTRTSIAFHEESIWSPTSGGIYREGVVGQPIAINPIISGNPTDQDISRLIYSNLSDLLENYELKDDGKTYVLKLKEGLKWDDGQPLTSNDVMFTLETVQDPASRSPFTKSWQGVVSERVSEVRVTLALRTPYVFFEENIERLPIIPQHIFGSIPTANLRLSSYNLEPVSSGPYSLKDFSKRRDGFISNYHLVPNENYSKEKPFIKDFYFKFYENADDLINDFLWRRIDGFGSLNPIDESKINPKKFVIKKIAMPRYYTIFVNGNVNPILKDQNLVSALALGINKNRIAEQVSGGAEKIFGPLGKFLNTSSGTPQLNYDPETAKKKIEALSVKKISLTLIVPKVDFLKKAADLIKADWIASGINEVNIVSLDPDELIENVLKSNNYELLLFGNALENPFDLFPFWHSSERFYPSLNLSLYKSSRVDTFLETIRRTGDPGERKSLALKAQDQIVSDNPAIFLFSLPYTYIYEKNLQGFNFEDEKSYIIKPQDRFGEVNKWYLSKVRVIK